MTPAFTGITAMNMVPASSCFQLLSSKRPLKTGEAHILVCKTCAFPLPPGMRDVYPDVWQTGRANLRTGAGAACGAHNCSLGRFGINCLWDKHQLETVSSKKAVLTPYDHRNGLLCGRPVPKEFPPNDKSIAGMIRDVPADPVQGPSLHSLRAGRPGVTVLHQFLWI